MPEPGVPESFKVLIKELQSLGLDVKVLDKDDEEIDLKQSFDDDDDDVWPAACGRLDLLSDGSATRATLAGYRPGGR